MIAPKLHAQFLGSLRGTYYRGRRKSECECCGCAPGLLALLARPWGWVWLEGEHWCAHCFVWALALGYRPRVDGIFR